MTALPPPLGAGELVLWRLDQAKYGGLWASGEGAYRVGGRWNSKGVRAVYASLDPATAILEVAVHKSFETLDVVAHVLTRARIVDAGRVHVVAEADLPNTNWLRSGAPSAGQQAFGDDLLRRHGFVLIPSVVSRHSWNVLFDPVLAEDAYDGVAQEPFALDTRLHQPPITPPVRRRSRRPSRPSTGGAPRRP